MFPFLPDMERQTKRDDSSKHAMEVVLQVPTLMETFDIIKYLDDSGHSASVPEMATSIMNKALELDANLDDWEINLPPYWKAAVTTISREMPAHNAKLPAPMFLNAEEIFKSEQYSNIWIASVVDFGRTTRIILRLFYIECAVFLSSITSKIPSTRPDHELSQSRKIIQEQVDHIGATIAFTLGYPIPNQIPFDEYTARSNARALGGYFLLWPLWNTLQLGFLPTEQVEWLSSWLRFICEARDIGKLDFGSASYLRACQFDKYEAGDFAE